MLVLVFEMNVTSLGVKVFHQATQEPLTAFTGCNVGDKIHRKVFKVIDYFMIHFRF